MIFAEIDAGMVTIVLAIIGALGAPLGFAIRALVKSSGYIAANTEVLRGLADSLNTCASEVKSANRKCALAQKAAAEAAIEDSGVISHGPQPTARPATA